MHKHLKRLIYKVTKNVETPKSISADSSNMLLHILNLSILIRIHFSRGHQLGHVWYHNNCEGLLYPNIVPLLLCYFHILRYNASKRGRDFWDTLYIVCQRSDQITLSLD